MLWPSWRGNDGDDDDAIVAGVGAVLCCVCMLVCDCAVCRLKKRCVRYLSVQKEMESSGCFLLFVVVLLALVFNVSLSIPQPD